MASAPKIHTITPKYTCIYIACVHSLRQVSK